MLGAFYALPTTFFDFTSSIRTDQALSQIGKSKVVDMRLEIFRSDILRSIGLILLTAAAVFAIYKKTIDKRIIFGFLAVVMIFEMSAVTKRYPINWVDSFEAA